MKGTEYMKSHQVGEKTSWKQQAQKDRIEWEWKRYAKGIALKARKKMTLLGMTQKELAEAMGCTQQYVSLILKGDTNLTMETMAKIEHVLDINLLGNCTNFDDIALVDGYSMSIQPRQSTYLSDNETPKYGSKH